MLEYKIKGRNRKVRKKDIKREKNNKRWERKVRGREIWEKKLNKNYKEKKKK